MVEMYIMIVGKFLATSYTKELQKFHKPSLCLSSSGGSEGERVGGLSTQLHL